MKLLFVIDNLNAGGAEKVLVDVLRNLNRENCEVDLFLIRKKGVYLPQIPNDIKIHYIYNDEKYEGNKFYKIYSILTKIHFKINRIIGLKNLFNKTINKKSFDKYIAFLEGAPIQLISDSNVQGEKIAWIHTEIGKHNIMNSEKEKVVMNNMDKIVCVSKGAKDSMIEKYPQTKNKIFIINNPIDIKEINRKEKEEINIEKANIPTFISVGRVEEVKGYDLLLKAHKNLLDNGINNKVLIVGDGSKRVELEKLKKELNIKNSFEFLGFHENPYKYFKLADYYVMPSRYEGYPLSLCEAIVLEKPVICSDFKSANEILMKEKLGVIFQRENLDDLEEKMKLLIENKDLISNLKEQCKINKNRFGFEKIIKEVNEILGL